MNQSINELNAANLVVILKLINRAQITGEEAEAAVEVKHKLAMLHQRLSQMEKTQAEEPSVVEVPESVEFEDIDKGKKKN